ncbi:MAG: single-stranded DNA-binding protein [Phycisphaerales bacterium]|jgi:single-strand DNA-binding protein|nr:single-stranded DNA-binding protein [Phycisphaeraceae bacterium]
MANYNKVMLMGNLTRDPEVRYSSNNNAICKIGLAVNRRYTLADGTKKEEVTFVDCDAFGKTGEAIGKYLSKGKPIFIEGHLKLDEWQDKQTNEKRTKLKVVIDTFQFIDSKGGPGGGGGGGDDGFQESAPPAGRVVTRGPAQPQAQSMSEDDIPF